MDMATLSATTGIWAWRIGAISPAVFARLNDKVLARYAFAMGVSTDALRALPPANADV